MSILRILQIPRSTNLSVELERLLVSFLKKFFSGTVSTTQFQGTEPKSDNAIIIIIVVVVLLVVIAIVVVAIIIKKKRKWFKIAKYRF